MNKHILVIALLTSTSLCSAQTVSQLIQQTAVEQTVDSLSSDNMQGRSIFTRGAGKAANFIENEFHRMKLEPLRGNVGYRQRFSVVRALPGKVSVAFDNIPVSTKNIFVACNGSFHWTNDNAIKVIKLEPGKAFADEYVSILRMKENALILVDQQYESNFRHMQKSLEKGAVSFKKDRPSAQVFVLGNYANLKSFSIDYEAKVQDLSLANIAGFIPGKTKPDEYVIFSAHYDHLGILKPVEQDSIANGADDDASGVSAVMALAKYYKKVNNNDRSIIFVAFTAEEFGLFGSQYFSTQIDPKNVVCMFNFELLGLVSKFGENAAFITGFQRSDFGQILQRNSKGADFTFYPDPYPKFDLFYRSDNASLARLGVPAHTISTGPIDMDKYYHTVKDEAKTLNFKNLTNTIRAIAVSSASIVNGKETPTRITIPNEN